MDMHSPVRLCSERITRKWLEICLHIISERGTVGVWYVHSVCDQARVCVNSSMCMYIGRLEILTQSHAIGVRDSKGVIMY